MKRQLTAQWNVGPQDREFDQEGCVLVEQNREKGKYALVARKIEKEKESELGESGGHQGSKRPAIINRGLPFGYLGSF